MSVIDLARFKEHLSEAVAANAGDAELQRTLDAAEALVAKRCGPLGAGAETLTEHAFGANLVLPRTRLQSITEVRDPDGNVVTLAPGAVNLLSGVITLPYRRVGAWQVDIPADADAALPADLELAILIIAAHLWETQRVPGANRSAGFGQPQGTPTPPVGFAIPNRAATLMAPYRAPVIA